MRGDREETPYTPDTPRTPDPGPREQGTSGGARGFSCMDHYDPDPHKCALGINQLVMALHKAFTKGNPQHPSKKGQKPRFFGGIGDDDLGSDDEGDAKPRVKIPLPIFKGLPGERPDAHLLAAEDWMEGMLFNRAEYNEKFKHTLQHLAREWYHGLDMGQFSTSWHEFTRHFSRYFSTQGRNIKHLHERWRTFSFDPTTDDIEEYIRDVHKAVKQHRHGDDAVLNLLKATMPTELYGTLYGHNNLYVVMTMLKDIYAKKPQNVVAAATRAAQGASAPFTLIHFPHQRKNQSPF